MQSQRSVPLYGSESPDLYSVSTSNPQARLKKSTLATIAVPSFSAFRAQTSSIPKASPVKRKPLPINASPIATKFTSPIHGPEKPTVPQNPTPLATVENSPAVEQRDTQGITSPTESELEQFMPRDLDKFPHGETPKNRESIVKVEVRPPIQPPNTAKPLPDIVPLSPTSNDRPSNASSVARVPSMYNDFKQLPPEPTEGDPRRDTMSASPSRAPGLTLQLDGAPRRILDHNDLAAIAKQPKSPGQRFTSFFGWKSTPADNTESPTTTFSDRSTSPALSPRPAGLDIQKANGLLNPYFPAQGSPIPPTPAMKAHIEDLLRELREVSSELAISVRREMELEDQVDQLKEGAPAGSWEANRRTSDYYSDSGASSVRYPVSEAEAKMEEVERARRRAEQARAQLRIDMSNRVQEAIQRERELEGHIYHLEQQLERTRQDPNVPENDRVRQLEVALENKGRRLNEEKSFKENFEDLIAALREELEQYRNERDNLKEEVVPQLRAQVEGLEAQIAETEGLAYENSKMQQELAALRAENQTLATAKRLQMEMQRQSQRFNTISEEGAPVQDENQSPRIGLSRSNSLARNAGHSRRGSLVRSNSIKSPVNPMADPQTDASFPTKIKEVEDQRDALHQALRNLRLRQSVERKKFERKIKAVEEERDRALEGVPRRMAYNKEVSYLRSEIDLLRQRTEDALEQKWQTEKNLGGLKMDLDRAEQETTSLRTILQDNPMQPLNTDVRASRAGTDDSPISASLDKAYRQLQTTAALSIAHIKDMEVQNNLRAPSPDAERTVELLKQSISNAETERDLAMQEAESYRRQARSLRQSEIDHLGKEQSLATQLYESATRMDELASQVQQQLTSNRELRSRLADAVSRGEKEQKSSAKRIIELQGELKRLEDQVMTAQQHSEDSLRLHEEEVRQLQESHNAQLQRLRTTGAKSPLTLSASGVLSAPHSPLFAMKSPRLDKTSSGLAVSLKDESRTKGLEMRVEELERKLREADGEMKEVVGRMNMAQIEVAQLQSEKDEAMMHTRRLQAQMEEEREKVRVLMAEEAADFYSDY